MIRKNRRNADIPASAMSDIAFLLIVFFMVTAVFTIREGLRFMQPDGAENLRKVTRDEVILVDVYNWKNILIDSKSVPFMDFKDRFEKTLKIRKEKPVLLRFSREAEYQLVVDIVDFVKAGGIDTLSIKMLK